MALQPSHMSCYALSVEEGTPLAADFAAGRLAPADEQTQKNCYYAAIETLAAAGLEHYEISNFARPGRRCRHNLTYWHNRPYVGIGPAAASYVAGTRRTNAPDLNAYLAALENSNRPDFPLAALENSNRPIFRTWTPTLLLWLGTWRLKNGRHGTHTCRLVHLNASPAAPPTPKRSCWACA
ncbi:MAG: hypothetical protein ABFD92_05110 [Planctomycetaceae bacterium]|nr:hypothetical protein [Planctomycetaceae bacterium]